MERRRYTAGIIVSALLLAGCGRQDDAAAAGNAPKKQEPLQEAGDSLAAGETAQEAADGSMVQETGDEPADNEESRSYYGVTPLSYDLSDLPPMENRLYAVWDDKIYFRQYSDEDMTDGGLWAVFDAAADTEKELMCMEPDGSVVQVGVDYGCDTMYIVEGRIYSQSLSEKSGYQVYSCGLDGKDRISYHSEYVLAIKGDKVICRTSGGGLAYIDARTGQERILADKEVQYLEADGKEIFVRGYEINSETGTEELVLYSIDYEGTVSALRMFTREEYIKITDEEYIYQHPMDIYNLKIMGDMIYFAAGSSNGNAYMYSGGPVYSMNRDGSDVKAEVLSLSRHYYLYDDGENRAVYYVSYDESYGESVGGEGRRKVTLYGEVTQEVVPWPSDYGSYDKPLIHGETGTVLFYPDTSGICYVLLTEKECEELSVKPYIDGNLVHKIHDIEYAGGKVFFTVTDVTYNREDSIGWRDYYNRGRSVCYCKDLKNGNIRPLYEY